MGDTKHTLTCSASVSVDNTRRKARYGVTKQTHVSHQQVFVLGIMARKRCHHCTVDAPFTHLRRRSELVTTLKRHCTSCSVEPASQHSSLGTWKSPVAVWTGHHRNRSTHQQPVSVHNTPHGCDVFGEHMVKESLGADWPQVKHVQVLAAFCGPKHAPHTMRCLG